MATIQSQSLHKRSSSTAIHASRYQSAHMMQHPVKQWRSHPREAAAGTRRYPSATIPLCAAHHHDPAPPGSYLHASRAPASASASAETLCSEQGPTRGSAAASCRSGSSRTHTGAGMRAARASSRTHTALPPRGCHPVPPPAVSGAAQESKPLACGTPYHHS